MSESCSVIIHPWDVATEFKLAADITDICHIWHTMVFGIAETGERTGIKPVRSTHASKPIDYGHKSFAVGLAA